MSMPVEKLATDIHGFDAISLGGLPKGCTTLVAGTSDSAKTIFAIQFLANGILNAGEGGVFVTFEEPAPDIRNNVLSLGWDIAAWEAAGQWAFVDASPQLADRPVVTGEYDLGALVARIEHAVRKIGAQRVSLDSLGAIFSRFAETNVVRAELFRIAVALKQLGVTAILTAERTVEYVEIARFGVEEFVANNVIILRNALERVSTIKGYREFVIGLTSFIKQQEATGMVTSTTPTLLGGTSITEAHISTITDSIILLRYVELFGEMRRCLTVLKMRGSMHDKDIREYTIDGHGNRIGKPFSNLTGIFSGNVVHGVAGEADRISNLFLDTGSGS